MEKPECESCEAEAVVRIVLGLIVYNVLRWMMQP